MFLGGIGDGFTQPRSGDGGEGDHRVERRILEAGDEPREIGIVENLVIELAGGRCHFDVIDRGACKEFLARGRAQACLQDRVQ
jgi:hypothetical protein